MNAGLDGIKNKLVPDAPLNINLFKADESKTKNLDKLPSSLQEAIIAMENSLFVKDIIPEGVIETYRLSALKN